MNYYQIIIKIHRLLVDLNTEQLEILVKDQERLKAYEKLPTCNVLYLNAEQSKINTRYGIIINTRLLLNKLPLLVDQMTERQKAVYITEVNELNELIGVLLNNLTLIKK